VGRVAAQSAFRPVRFVPNAKLTRLDKLAVAFDALALSRLTGCLPPIAKIIHGPDYTVTAVRLPKLVDEAQSYIAELRAQQASAALLPVILNKHCPACAFQSRCHQVATEQARVQRDLAGQGRQSAGLKPARMKARPVVLSR